MKMNYAAIALVILLVCFWYSITNAAEEPKQGIDPGKMLRAIREIEGWKPGAIGKAGEVGPYQMMPATWSGYSHMPPSYAENENYAKGVAILHLSWVRSRLHRLGYIETPYTVALLWTCGYGVFTSANVPKAKISYAIRCSNIYRTLK